MSDTPVTDLWDHIRGLKKELLEEVIPAIRETQAVYHELVKKALSITSRIDDVAQKLLVPVVEETDIMGTGSTGRRRRSTNLEVPSGEEKAPPVKKAAVRQVREMSGELVVPGSGKRGCSNCKRTGHRAKNCPN